MAERIKILDPAVLGSKSASLTILDQVHKTDMNMVPSVATVFTYSQIAACCQHCSKNKAYSIIPYPELT